MLQVIGHFINTSDFGGAESIVLDLSKKSALIDDQYKFIIFGFDNSWISKQCIKNKIKFIALPLALTKHWSVNRLPIFAWKFGKLLKQHNITILHSHLYSASVRGGLTSLFYNIPHVGTLHDSYSVTEKPSRGKWMKMVFKTGAKLVAVSNNVKKSYSECCCIPFNKIKTIYNGVASKSLITPEKIDHLRKEFKIRPNENVIISVGRLERIKRFDLVIDTCLSLKNKHVSNFKILIVGDGDEKDVLQKQINDNHLNNIITLTGYRTDVPDLLQISNIFLLTSESEGLSGSILEAMVAGLPIVASDVGGNNELVTDANGMLIKFGDIETTAQCLASLLNDSTQMKVLGLQSQQRATKHFSQDKMLREYLKIYHSFSTGKQS